MNPKPVASPVTLSGEKCMHCGAEIEIQEGRWWGWVHGSDCPENHPDGHKPVAVTLSEGQPKSFKSEQCVCGHGSIQHEWEDEFTSCCMAHLRLFNGVGEGKPCMCTGYKPLSEGQETQEKKS